MAMLTPPVHTSPLPAHVAASLAQRTYFKVIVGGSFNELERVARLVEIYTLAGVDAIDISADPAVVSTAVDVLDTLESRVPTRPMLMASFPLDDDPHFRKIELKRDACIDCGVCVPECPTDVFAMDAHATLQMDVPLCYGCGRCVPACPTDALSLDTFSIQPGLSEVLLNPKVSAIELHSRHADPFMIAQYLDELGEALTHKYVSFCYRPATLPDEQNRAVLETLSQRLPFPFMIQVDGLPMSATSQENSSLPALSAAQYLAPMMPKSAHLTISGGINHATAQHLKQPHYEAVSGVGMGTYARQAVWPVIQQTNEAVERAKALISDFKHR